MTYACVFALVSVVVGVIVFHKNQDKFIYIFSNNMLEYKEY